MTDAEILALAAARHPPAGPRATYPMEWAIQAFAENTAIDQARQQSPLVDAAVSGLRRSLSLAHERISTLNRRLDTLRAALTATDPLLLIKALLNNDND